MVRLLIAAAVLAMASTAAAKVWPSPAAGVSRSGGPEILFTFDDGPNATWTPKILDILKQHQIRAVFFIVGARLESGNKKVPEIIDRILREGHVIANHTMTHPDLCNITDLEADAEIDNGKAVIEKFAKVPLVWFRAPFGARCDRLEAQLAARATSHMHWDLDPQEWRHSSNPKKVVAYVTRSLSRSRARNVLLLHDMKAVTVKALPEILGWITEENTRRALAHEPMIRILHAPELAAEQLPAGLIAWAGEATARLRGLRADLASVLPEARSPSTARPAAARDLAQRSR